MATQKPVQDNAAVTVKADGGVMLVGADLVDKAEVEGKKFRITALKNEVSKTSGALGLWVEAELDSDGSLVMFNDYGKGMRGQIDPYLDSIGKAGVLDEWIDLPEPIVCPRGVRISHYDTTDDRGKPTRGKTAYLTTSGGRS
jgi:hypothetical protein